MAHFRGNKSAFGAPGSEPRWTNSDKEGVGTAYSKGSQIWFTVWRGILTEVYYPTVDRPQLRDLQFIFADGAGMFLEEKKDLDYQIERLSPSQGYKVTARERQGRFSYTKEIIADPERPCVLLHTQMKADEAFLRNFQMHLLLNPHLGIGGEGNNAFVVEVSGRELLVAEKESRWLVVGASCPFSKLSCGYVGQSDGYTDLARNGKMSFEFDEAKDGNVALMGRLDLSQTLDFTIGVSMGESLPSAVACLFQSLSLPYQERRTQFFQQWKEVQKARKPLEKTSGDGGHLFEASYNLLLTHEDKRYQGAFVASLAIPWGEARNDKQGKGGYHLVWTRDMVESAMGLLAAGYESGPFHALVYLAALQEEAGNFPQNFWVNGEAYWTGNQLDEVAFPILLAWRLHQSKLLHSFDPTVLVNRAANFLLHSGPVTGEERWEEASGYSPSTLAAIIAAFVCAASFARNGNDEKKAAFLESYADYLRAHLEGWTVTTKGTLLPGCSRYFVRLNPAKPGHVASPSAVDSADLKLSSQPPDSPQSYPARNIVDGGFLQLVRYGVLSADDPLVVDTLRVIDATIKVDTPLGPCWHRYNHDGYGQKPDGGPYQKWGQGGLWPLLVGERGHYELAAGNDSRSLLQAMERFSGSVNLLPEQVWNGPDLPGTFLRCGGPSGSANPLLWAHSEYIRLLRSCHDGEVFDRIPEVAARYGKAKLDCQHEFWLPKHPISEAEKSCNLRICAAEPFLLRWTADNWKSWQDSHSQPTGIGGDYFDLSASEISRTLEFTFFWKERNQWEGQNHQVRTS